MYLLKTIFGRNKEKNDSEMMTIFCS
uniref:Uncharacterized protein n=1 Tax=Anguilla anguilla TaxID=7936 RepID=A0A0E9U0K0_ANGAN